MIRRLTQIGGLAAALALVAAAALGFAPPAQAADFRTGEEVIIAANEVIDDDLFVAGERVEVNGTVKGDLFAFGSEVIVNGTVEGSLFVGGQTAEVNGPVGGSVYGGAYSLVAGPEAAVGRNLYFGGFSLETEAGGGLGRSLYVGGYQATVAGEVAHDVRAGVGALELNGPVGGDVVVELDTSDLEGAQPPTFFFPGMPARVRTLAPGLRLGPDAAVAGSLWYQSKSEQPVSDGAVGGAITFATPQPSDQPAASEPRRDSPVRDLFRGFSERAGEFIALMIVGGVLLGLWPAGVRRASAQVQEHPLPSTGRGLLVASIFFVAVPIAAIAIFAAALLGGLVTYGQLFSAILGVGSAALGLSVTVFLFVLSLVTKVVVGYLVGRLILARLAPRTLAGRWGDLLALAGGVLIYEVLRAIPILGWVIALIVILVGLGAIYFVARETLRRPAPAIPAAPVAA